MNEFLWSHYSDSTAKLFYSRQTDWCSTKQGNKIERSSQIVRIKYKPSDPTIRRGAKRSTNTLKIITELNFFYSQYTSYTMLDYDDDDEEIFLFKLFVLLISNIKFIDVL